MVELIVYLLPISGTMLLKQLEETEGVRIKGAFLPESFQAESQDQVIFLNQNEIPYKIPGKLSTIEIKEWVQEMDLDLGVSVGYDKKLPGWLVAQPEHGTANIHPALLPRYRGANPYFWVIKNREEKTGTTLHYMDEQFDTGPIISQQTISLEGNETMGEIFFELNNIGCSLALNLINQVKKSQIPAGESQPEKGDFPEAPRVNERHLRIDWSVPYEEIDALVRAGNPFFGAYTTFRGSKLKVYEIEKDSLSAKASPGSIKTSKDGPKVRCADSWVRLKSVRMGHYYVGTGKSFQTREEDALAVLNKMV